MINRGTEVLVCYLARLCEVESSSPGDPDILPISLPAWLGRALSERLNSPLLLELNKNFFSSR